MKAITFDQYGSPDVLHYADVTQPVPGPGEVLVRVHASSVNFADRAAMRGSPGLIRLVYGVPRPRAGARVLGRDVAGTVVAVGPDATRFEVGDEVLGEMSQHGFAEYVAAPEAHLVAKPAGVTFEQAATLPVAATTALQALRAGGVTAGRTVLVNGASGGVGTFAVQLATILGATVTAVCRTRNIDLVRSIGAQHVVDYTREDVTRGTARFDVIIDLAGDHRVSEFRRILTRNGTYVSSSGTGVPVFGPLPRLLAAVTLSPLVSQRLRGVTAKRNAADLAYLVGLVAAGSLTPVIERTYPLAEAADAIRHVETAHPRGKIVLTVH